MPFRWANLRGNWVIASFYRRLGVCLAGWAAVSIAWTAAAESSKPIRLRVGAIDPAKLPSSTESPSIQAKSSHRRANGLFLIQFNGPFAAEWPEILREFNVILLRPVPEDAYVAQLTDVSLVALRAFPFVNWVGEYRAEYKLHPKLQMPRDQSDVVPISVVLAATASAPETAKVRRAFKTIKSESTSRFGTVVQGELKMARLGGLAQSTAVLWIEPQEQPKLHDEVSSVISGGGRLAFPSGGPNPSPTSPAYTGAGVTVAVIDSGLDGGKPDQVHPDLAGRVAGLFQYGGLTDASDSHGHGTHVAGIIAGTGATGESDEHGRLYGLGVAPGARIVAQRIFDSSGHYSAPENYGVLARDAVRAGAVIGSNSWGEEAQGRYDVAAMEFDALVRDADAETVGDQPYVIVSSVGNAGPGKQTINSPAVAKNVISTGASQNERRGFLLYADGKDAMADFSSRGPCEDGRLKPDLVAPGTWIASLQSSIAGDQNAWMPISSRYFYLGGTSQSAPHVAGAAALFVEYHRQVHNSTPSPALIKAALINSAYDMDNAVGTSYTPNMDEGWGRVNAANLLGNTRTFQFEDQSKLLTTGNQFEKRVLVVRDRQPFTVTMAYTDVPGMPAAIPALVNDLDLEVVAPDGRIYRGNQFQNGESMPGRLQSDRINNVEGVRLRNPLPGEYIVRVRAANVMEDARKDTPAVDQDFALAISGDLSRNGVAVVLLDQSTYTAPGTIQLKLIDFDLAGRETAEVRLRSSTEHFGEPVVLRAAGGNGVFTGLVATVISTATGPGGPPLPGAPLPGGTNNGAVRGVLELRHGDVIEALYEDRSPSAIARSVAVADLQAPVVSNVTWTNRLGKTWIMWETSEPSSSVVSYGASTTQMMSVTNLALKVHHEIALDALVAGTEYHFSVRSSDQAGNWSASVDLFNLVGRPAATVLIVDGYEPDTETILLPITEYTDPLDQIGVSYEVWNLKEAGSPTAADLQPFRVVMWRISDSIFVTSGLSLEQQQAIQEYVENGGSFFMASMEILSRLGDTEFRTRVLQVAEFKARVELFGECVDCDQDAGVPSIAGSEFDWLMNGVSMGLDYSRFAEISELGVGPDFGDTFTASADAAPILVTGETGRTVGVRFPRNPTDQSGRVVFVGFPLESVPVGTEAPNSREAFLRNVLSFLAPGADGVGTVAFDRMRYTIPGRITVEVADSDLIGRGELGLRVHSGTTTAGQPLKLTETVRPGLFRGSVVLAGPNSLSIGQLKARQGDMLWAEYRDESGRTVARAIASVDTVHPIVSQISAEAEYESAWIQWQTSEPSDALVQFGESVFLGRTAYRGSLAGEHRLEFSGLKPDRTYYYQVVSRDPAGNASIDNNGGRLYTFRTLKPLSVPWDDHLESTADSTWKVVDETAGTASWTRGTPTNGHEESARSGARAWGSNLSGRPIELGDTRLVSPAIHLTGGNRARLRYWQSYSFSSSSPTDIWEFGRVVISGDNGRTWTTLAEYTESSSSWKPVEIDLSDYLGKVVRIGWHYGLLSLERSSRPGWLIDDISISVDTQVRGTVRVSSNLSQAGFQIAGPITHSGSGTDWFMRQAPAGEYVVRFAPVPYYETPPPQTNILNSPTTMLFHGSYTFRDQNQNGMSDAWETEFFGAVSPFRTPQTDSDGDGLSDLDEFSAGTNPADAQSRLSLMRVDRFHGGAILAWPAVPGRMYRLHSSTDNIRWQPLLDWQRATSSESTQTLALPSEETAHFFRLEVRP